MALIRGFCLLALLALGLVALPCAAQEEPAGGPPPPREGPGGPPPQGPGGFGPGGPFQKIDRTKLESFEKARAKGEILFDMAQMYRKAGRMDDALATCRKIADMEIPVLEGHPDSRAAAGKKLMIYAFMADLLREKKDYAGALKALEDGQKKAAGAADAPPEMRLRAQVELLKGEARIHQEQGNVEKAAEAYQKALAIVEK
ncbi:MAG: tetratricopeptide repeat protein [Candidatus Wallbacteria bacterium]|nr:tetratricopeptide repeat protein [Candidatus Wallbacteria bacterium]